MIRGGIFMISKGYTEANYKFLKLYDPNKSTSYITYLDANNLYGNSMMQLLSFEVLDWVNSENLNLDNFQDDLMITMNCIICLISNYLVATQEMKLCVLYGQSVTNFSHLRNLIGLMQKKLI